MIKLNTIDADTLMSTPLPVTRFIVEGLLPEGLHILAGSPKIGKSWLALWICLRVLLQPAKVGIMVMAYQAELHCAIQVFLYSDQITRFPIIYDGSNIKRRNCVGNTCNKRNSPLSLLRGPLHPHSKQTLPNHR